MNVSPAPESDTGCDSTSLQFAISMEFSSKPTDIAPRGIIRAWNRIMKKHAPQVREYMTHMPIEAEKCETALDALRMMQRHRVQHLPVMNGSHLKGIVSEEDLLRAKVEREIEFSDTPLDQLLRSEVLIVSPIEPIDEVSRKFLSHNGDCAAVVDGGFVVGIFTTTDVLRFVGDYFGQTKVK